MGSQCGEGVEFDLRCAARTGSGTGCGASAISEVLEYVGRRSYAHLAMGA